jgi:6-phosphogluconolactonase (cycloisomerase 2 family)
MTVTKITAFSVSAALLALAGCGASSDAEPETQTVDNALSSDPPMEGRPPVPSSALAVPDGYNVAFHLDATGVQIYTCQATGTGFAWAFKAPEANLYDDTGKLQGTHFAGPTWKSLDGSSVVGSKIASYTVTPSAIPWLLLKAVSHDGEGRMTNISYIQRLQTVSGVAPAYGCDAAHVGGTARVPYRAVYYFYEPDAANLGAVFTIDNGADANHVLAFLRNADGSLVPAGQVATGGRGTGKGLGTQGAVTLSGDHRFLLVVNAGSNEVSSFAVNGARLQLRSRVSSGGISPGSVAVHGHGAYVLNGGEPNNVSGFFLGDDGKLSVLPNATRALSGPSVAPAQVGFSADGERLIVTEKGTNKIDTFGAGNSVFRGRVTHDSVGKTPFGFAVTRAGTLIVSDAFGGLAGKSALSAYDFVGSSLSLKNINGAVPDGQTAACWVAVTGDGRFAYTTNFGSGNLSIYDIADSGALSLQSTVSTGANSKPTDLEFDRRSRSLYVLGGNNTIVSFKRNADGSLVGDGVTTDIPAAAVGLAAF